MRSGIFFLILAITGFTSCKEKTLFESVDPSHSGIHFNNIIQDNDSMNVLEIENIYNGGGVAIADFNNDGLQDIYFTGNMVSNKLYLNKGDFKFEDITTEAGVSGEGRWSRGVSTVDINSDGLMDIYVCATIYPKGVNRTNILYINQGLSEQGIPRFKNMAAEYGLDDTTHSTMAAFFDYDNDGDLDMYLLVNQILKNEYPNGFRPVLKNGEHPSTGRLYMNRWDSIRNHPVFTDVSKEAGVTIEGYGHGVSITDINLDGWKDIYVTNDFLSNNILYINNKNGTFTDKVFSYFKHTSANAMGQDIQDVNNDGLVDIIELDMLPEDNFRKKMMMSPNSYQTYQNSDYFGYQYQYVRNTLQLNMGPRVNANDSIGDPVFSDIGFYSGIAETDWSWTPLVVDFDNDGFRDIIVTNGFPKDVTDHDFIVYRNKASLIASKRELLDAIPQVKLKNYAFKNNGDLTFSNVSTEWNMGEPSYSNGAAYADLDNDGDLDYVVNNINDKAFVFKNNSNRSVNDRRYLRIKFNGENLNINGIGAWAHIYYDSGKHQVYENTPYRGYLSSIEPYAHFGLGKIDRVDSVVIHWNDGRKQTIKNVNSNQTLVVDIKNAFVLDAAPPPVFAQNTILSDITDSVGITYHHKKKDFIDFNVQKLLPHKFSEYSPGIAVGDLDANGLDDLVIGGSAGFSPTMLLQQLNGTFITTEVLQHPGNKNSEDLGILIFDADLDGDNDILTVGGGYEKPPDSDFYQDYFYVNDGKGGFTPDTLALPKNFTSKSCVRAADFDQDGDLDLFIGGRVLPWHYPKPVSSFIYRNDSENGKVKFTDVTEKVAKRLTDIGMICDAVWSDFDNDGWIDLVLAGEWMPVVFLRNNHGVFEDITETTGVARNKGWWSSILSGDFDNDGDIDYVVGNLGLNSLYKATEKLPAKIYAKDFDNNGSYDAIPTMFFPISQENRNKKEFFIHTRDDMIKQMISTRAKFPNYKSYSTSSIDHLLGSKELEGAVILEATNFSHCLFRNNGNNKFEVIPLPNPAQYSCINGMIAEDFNGDGNLDLLISGNDYGTEVTIGRYDACNGLYMKGDGMGNFVTSSILESGLYIPGNGKALVKLRNKTGNCLVAAGQNNGPLKVFLQNVNAKQYAFNPDDISVNIFFGNGVKRKHEINYGSSFLSQSARFINLPDNVTSLEITNSKGEVRRVNP